MTHTVEIGYMTALVAVGIGFAAFAVLVIKRLFKGQA